MSAFDSTEAAIVPRWVTITQLGGRKDLSKAKTLPYGAYIVRGQAPGLVDQERHVLLEQPTLHLRVPLRVGMECEDGLVQIEGAIVNAAAGGLWIKAFPVIASGGAETRPDSNGHFVIAGLPNGEYFLLGVNGKRILYSETVFTFNKPIELDLRND